MQRELSLRGFALGAVITAGFTAANVYLGLRVGLTFATSIPAAVISMALLRSFRNSGILENNIVQTIASSAGTLSCMAFVLPGLIMVGWWTSFPYWTTFLICACGGVLGVMFSIPLRRALVARSPLPFPEGVAAAEVLLVGAASRSGAPESIAALRSLVASSLASALFAAGVAAHLLADHVVDYFRRGPVVTGMGYGFSLALLGGGHLVGPSVGLAMGAGVVISWAILIPLLSALHPVAGPAGEIASGIWAGQVRYVGVGAIGLASLWALADLAKSFLGDSFANLARRSPQASNVSTASRDRDIPAVVVCAIVLAILLPVALLLRAFLAGHIGTALSAGLVIGGLVYVLVVGACLSVVCGYMAGLIGASNSPLSGAGILAILVATALLLTLAPVFAPATRPLIVAYVLFVTAIVFAAAAISNDNLQDLKTGMLVGASPWRQQVALIVGVLCGSLVMPLILNLLNRAYGFATLPGVSAHASGQFLPAPQATLIAALTRGMLAGGLDWQMIEIGAAIGLALIALDKLASRLTGRGVPPLAAAMGIYLPMTITVPVVTGAFLGCLYDSHAARSANPEAGRRLGTLMASGLIVGESLFGVLLAILIVLTGNGDPLALFALAPPLPALFAILTLATTLGVLYRANLRAADDGGIAPRGTQRE